MTTLVIGGRGALGQRLVERIASRGERVRVLNRTASPRAASGPSDVCVGDVRDAAAVDAAARGCAAIVLAMHGLLGRGGASPWTVDVGGTETALAAARRHGVGRIVLLSLVGAAPDNPFELARAKWAAEQRLRASGLRFTIVRATAFMQTWVAAIGPLTPASPRAHLFGRGHNPINFVAVQDVAAVVDGSLAEDAGTSETIEVAGPANFSLTEFIHTVACVRGIDPRQVRIDRVPRPVLRVGRVALRPIFAPAARLMDAGLAMDTAPLRAEPSLAQARYVPEPTPLRAVISTSPLV